MRLFCRVGLFLSMDRNGTVSGVLQKNGTKGESSVFVINCMMKWFTQYSFVCFRNL